MQSEIIALVSGLEKDRDHIIQRQDNNCEHMFIDLGNVLSGPVMQAINDICENIKQNVNFYSNGWQTRLSRLNNMATTALVTPLSVVGASSSILPTAER